MPRPAEPLAPFRASSHPLAVDRPSPNFFHGAVLGNGALGAVACVRPDGIMIHLGHNDVWDIRIAERHREQIGTFREVFDRVRRISPDLTSLNDDPWYRQYVAMAQENYIKPYPRPFPCGSVMLGVDRREVEMLGYRIEIDTGLCRVDMLVGGRRRQCLIRLDMAADRVWVRCVDEQGAPAPWPFCRLAMIPDPDTPADLPRLTRGHDERQHTLWFRQVLPQSEPVDGGPGPASPADRAFRLALRTSGPLQPRAIPGVKDGRRTVRDLFQRTLTQDQQDILCIQLDQGLASAVPDEPPALPPAVAANFSDADVRARRSWSDFWSRSAVRLDDQELERAWYWNLYFLNCALKPGVTCPGLFANWSYRRIGTAWHGDYHMNYNTQQPFWGVFSCNHVEKNLCYVDLVDKLMPVSRVWAQEYYGLRGAYFPHSAYPVTMTMSPYPVPTWGWEICETPWTVQGLWWHYLYTMDREFLRQRAFTPMREAVLFMVDYMLRPEAHGPNWGDDRHHIFPTVPPELYGLMPGFRFNHDCLIDLTLTRFLFDAFERACRDLGVQQEQAPLLEQVRGLLSKFPEYPRASSPRGEVYVSAPGEDPDMVYNVPVSLATVFPGEEHGLHSPPADMQRCLRSLQQQQNEGGNELVFLNLQAARLGALDLERFKRQIRYCLLPNGTLTNMVLQAEGRYGDTTDFEHMAPMGIWFENFALPVVINECLLQSYTGTLRLFANWPLSRAAQFHTLRAAGGFLVSAACGEDVVKWVSVTSEAGQPLRMINPWPGAVTCTSDGGAQTFRGAVLELATQQGQSLRFTPAG